MLANFKRVLNATLIGAVMATSISPAFAQQGRLVDFKQNLVEPQQADPARELFNVGQKYYDMFRYADAERTFREVVVKYPKSNIADRAGYYLIRTLWQSGKRNDALEQINTFPKMFPRSLWNADVEEIRIQLTNQVPPQAITILMRAKALQATVKAQVPAPPAPAVPPAPRVPQLDVNLDPQISLLQEMMRAMFRSDMNRGLQIAMDRLKANMADPVVLSSLDVVAQSASAQAMPFLLQIAKNSPNMGARKDAIFWMSRTPGDKDAVVDAVMGLLPTMPGEDGDAITYTLSQLRTEKANNALAAIARDKSRSFAVRSSALMWLGQSRMPERVSVLEEIYKNSGDDIGVRSQVLMALSQSRDAQAVNVLANIAGSDPDFNLRKQAVMWLGQVHTPEATQALENLLRRK